MKMIILVLTVFMFKTAYADWQVKELNQEIKIEENLSLTGSVLQFKSKDGQTVIFEPSVEPHILSDVRKYVFDGQTYFLSTWVGGASSIVIRVFNPASSHLPVCQEVSDAEDADLRRVQNVLEIKVTKRLGNKAKDKWVPCYKIPSRTINSKKVDKPAKVVAPSKAKK